MAATIGIWVGLLPIVVLVTMLARYTSFPEPILLVPAGLILGTLPGVAPVDLESSSIYCYPC